MTSDPIRSPAAVRAVRRLAAGAALLGTAACATGGGASGGGTEAASSVPVVAITRSMLLPTDPARAFAFIAAEDVLPKVLTGYGPLPAVVRTSDHTGPWDVPGSARIVHLADGSTVREQVTLVDAPGRFAYRVWDFGHPVIAALATQGRGDWTFTAVDGGTRVDWTYAFDAKGTAASVPLRALVAVLWRGYMDTCLENARRALADGAKGA
ncbi:MAG: SRPBCC family protein [Burkholderiales bacterium]